MAHMRTGCKENRMSSNQISAWVIAPSRPRLQIEKTIDIIVSIATRTSKIYHALFRTFRTPSV
eukprot:CAMPEP_0169091762 /NCGR_PEP_ID=MMETSP1015-20121227/16546_1 /TAXON_ID=342587 /ORGANISM="Karlodinium micrum, Strain CCMP2283" /LENGTH=62 /DNA_ID=CAMNT_0009152297 /DNA_START=251 /DNA_END=439 /DNA_ORIENTATION=-